MTKNSNSIDAPCCCQDGSCSPTTPFPMHGAGASGAESATIPAPSDETCSGDVCCGPPPGPPSGACERPGYRICPFVETFVESPAGAVPRVRTRLDLRDRLGAAGARIGTIRSRYRVAPGLYAVGRPDSDSPVLASANYKLSFDSLRGALKGVDAWILVLDTRGVNVWCAAGKALFSTAEVVRRVGAVDLTRVVRHRRLILPQLSATGVSAHEVRKACGFHVEWGPVRAADIPAFLRADNIASEEMRTVTFSLAERLVLVPVELAGAVKPGLVTVAAAFLLSGVGPGIFSISQAWARGWALVFACLIGLFAGAVVMPALLPWLPSRRFSVKGLFTSLPAGILAIWVVSGIPGSPLLNAAAVLAATAAVGSFTAMNFTGSTPYTSPSGVEKEMRTAIPLQMLCLLAGIAAWVAAPFAA